MRSRLQIVNSLLFAGGLASATLVGACYHHHYRETETTYTVQWSAAEEPRYERWENETHRSHQDWDRRKSDEQHDYWEWRKQHND